MKVINVFLDDFEAELAKKIGDGDLPLGIRRAVVLAGLRSEETPHAECENMNQNSEKLTIVTDRMAALAEELKQVQNIPSRREEIATQLIRLGRIYLAIRGGRDLVHDDL